MSETAGISDENSMFSPPHKRKTLRQAFREEWLKGSAYISWLSKAEDPFSAYCKICRKTFVARKHVLDRHMTSNEHTCMRSLEGAAGAAGAASYSEEVKRAEIRYALDVIDHNRSFYSYRHFVGMSQKAAPRCEVFKGLTFKQTKIAAIVKNIISKYIVSETISALQNKYFSILMDESTDIANIQNACILVRYMDGAIIKTYLLDLLITY